jgi:hypothetical protein
VQIQPQEKQRRDPEEKPGSTFACIEQPKKEASKGEGEHLRPHTPAGSGGQSAEHGCREGPEPLSGTAQVEQQKAGCRNDRRENDQGGVATVFPKFEKDYV